MTFERRLAAAEQQHGVRPRAAYAFVPIDVARTSREATWLADERRRQGLEPRDEMTTFCWGPPQ